MTTQQQLPRLAAPGAELPPELVDEGACTKPGVDPDWFIPEAKEPDIRRAQRVCDSCPVLALCDQWATEHDEWGVWAGRMRRNHKSLGDPDVRAQARQLFAEGKDHVEVARLLGISVQTAIGFFGSWRRDRGKGVA